MAANTWQTYNINIKVKSLSAAGSSDRVLVKPINNTAKSCNNKPGLWIKWTEEGQRVFQEGQHHPISGMTLLDISSLWQQLWQQSCDMDQGHSLPIFSQLNSPLPANLFFILVHSTVTFKLTSYYFLFPTFILHFGKI